MEVRAAGPSTQKKLVNVDGSHAFCKPATDITKQTLEYQPPEERNQGKQIQSWKNVAMEAENVDLADIRTEAQDRTKSVSN